MRNLRILMLLSSLSVSVCGEAAPGDVDSSFNAGSVLDSNPLAIVAQPDGKLLIGGSFTTVPALVRRGIARLNRDGTGDATFNAGKGANGTVWTIALQPDGKIILGGDFTEVNGLTRNRLARLNPDGTLDGTFNPGAGADDLVRAIAVQQDGKVLVCGYFTHIQGAARNYIARLNADGTLDSTFNPGTGPNFLAARMLLQSDGRILLGGYFSSFNGVAVRGLVRLLQDGQLDPSFRSNAGVPGSVVEALALQSDGRILVGGNFFARLNIDGTLDASFQAAVNELVDSIAVQLDGKILLGGQFRFVNGEAHSYLARLNTNGAVDSTFRPRYELYPPGVEVVAIEPSGTILVSASFDGVEDLGYRKLVRFNSDGSLDHGFETSRGISGTVYEIQVQPDTKLLISGFFRDINGSPNANIARFSSNGNLDATFDAGPFLNTAFFSTSNSVIYSTALQPDGKIIIGGGFTNIAGIGRNNIARLNPDGTVDTTFDPGSAADYSVYRVLRQSDGKLLIAGGFETFDGRARHLIARVLQDGSLDEEFHPDLNGLPALALQADGKIIIGGDFTQVNGAQRQYIARLNPDGSLDNSFSSLELDNYVEVVTALKTGKILISGPFTRAGGVSRKNIARLNADGTLDLAFDPGAGLDGRLADNLLSSYLEFPEGKVLIWGQFTNVNGISSPGLARLNVDGTPDRTFKTASGLWDSVLCAQLLPDQKILIGGYFSSVGDLPRHSLARLFGDAQGPVIVAGPVSQTNYVGRATTFAVSASGEPPLTYQWYRDGAPLSDGPRISGSASQTLTIDPIQFRDAGLYAVSVSNLSGSTTSAPAFLQVLTPSNNEHARKGK